MICPTCRNYEMNTDTYCRTDGAKLLDVRCLGCGRSLIFGQKFCGGCGKDVRGMTEAAIVGLVVTNVAGQR